MPKHLTLPIALFLAPLAALHAAESKSPRPNVIYIMDDELGYHEPGFMGGQNIKTPHLDRMAAEGVRFKNIFAGSSVCAPTRCCFLTGKHSGHTSVRANGGGTPLRADEVTIADMLMKRGCATGGFGKWGCGGRDSTGVPEQHGFDVFPGNHDQVHAHTCYPPYLIRNSEEVKLENLNDRTKKPVGRLHMNGKLMGSIENGDLTFGWDPESVLLVLGASYVGHMDDPAVFNRALNDAEVRQLFALKNGAGELHP